jgi:uncharacterized protein DUF4175
LNKIDIEINEVKARLGKLHRKIVTVDLLKGLLLLVIVFIVTNLTLSVLELMGLNSIEERTALFFLGVSVFVAAFVFLIGVPIARILKSLKTKDFLSLSVLVGSHFKEIDDKLINTIQLFGDEKKSELKDAAILSELNEVKQFNLTSVVSFTKLKKTTIIVSASIIATVLLFYSFSSLRISTIRILNFSHDFVIPQKYQFYIEPQNSTVSKGENVVIKTSVIGGKPSFITLFLKDKENQNYLEKTITPDSNNVFLYSINSISSTTYYYVKAEDIISDKFKITVIDKPIISQLELKIIPPAYTGLESTIQKDNGNIFALVGSEVKLNIISSKNLNSGVVQFSDNTKKELTISENSGNTRFKILKNKKYKIVLSDVDKNSNDNPIEYTIKTKIDEFPLIEVLKPEGDVSLTKAEAIYTELLIKDDFGFRKLTLNHKLVNTSFGFVEDEFSNKTIPIRKNITNQEVYFTWSLSELMLAAGDIVSFYFEVFDNDNINGPKSAKSKIFQLRVPTMEELFNDAEVVQEDAQMDLEETLKEAEKLKEDMKNLSNELKKDDKEITWDEKKKIEETAERFEKLQNQIDEAQKKIEEAKKNLDDNNLLSKETLEKYNELQKLMDNMNSEEMKKAIEQLQKQMETMNRDKAQQALGDMEFDEEMFKKSIERTVNLLKRIQIEQKMDEVIKRTEELQKEIDELKEKTEKSDLSNETEKNDLAKKEEEVSKQLEQLKEEMKKLQDKMGEFKEMPNEKMEELQKEMEAQKNEELTEQAKEMLQKNMKQEAMEQMQKLSQNMEQMKNQMQQMQQQMQQQNEMQVLFEMMKGVNNLLSLSKEEESLKNSMAKSNPNSEQYLNNLQKQKEISDGLSKTLKGLSELSQKTFAITPEMGKALGNANKEMNNAMQGMQNRNSTMAMAGQKGAMKYLNEAATMMKGNMEQMMNGGGQGGGMMSMMQQMQQMSQQQMGLNQLTQQLKQGGRLTPQQQAGLERLAEQQEMIRKSLEQLNKETKERGESKTLTSNLEDILEEMREVITNMNTNKVDDNLIKSQNNILSKLLDAQRSINERDFEKNRESNSAKNFNRQSPEELKLNSEKNKIKDELMKLINEGYSKDYEDLIKKYYKILEAEKKN